MEKSEFLKKLEEGKFLLSEEKYSELITAVHQGSLSEDQLQRIVKYIDDALSQEGLLKTAQVQIEGILKDALAELGMLNQEVDKEIRDEAKQAEQADRVLDDQSADNLLNNL